MAEIKWSQDVFSKGEISPLLYSRVTLDAYYKGLKRAKNCITYPQGGVGKRFGTIYLNEISGVTNYKELFFETFQYLTECNYLIVMTDLSLKVYLEGNLVATVATSVPATELQFIDSTTFVDRFVITTRMTTVPPFELKRTDNAPDLIAGSGTNFLTLTTPLTDGFIYPVRFTNPLTNPGDRLPATTPQIIQGRTYFVKMISTTNAEIYANSYDAYLSRNKYAVADAGVGTNNAVIRNTWAINNIAFKNLPAFDFGDINYYNSTFTPGAPSGLGVTITVSTAIFPNATIGALYVGGLVTFNGGVGKIVAVTGAYPSSTFTVDILTPFVSTAATPGRLVYLAQTAWNSTRGWPQKCSSFQSRFVLGNTEAIPNGLWLSATNDFTEFGLFTQDAADDPIAWYPTSDNVNVINFIVPYRSLTIHSNTGIYSTPLSFETALTPTNFSMSLQDSTPATAIAPRGIDNQIVVISGNDVHSMLWDGFNNSYSSNIASVASEHLISNPHDESEFQDLSRAGSRYMFIINDDGSLIIFQTLVAEGVQGFTPQYLEQSYGQAYFRWATSSSDGRAWFITEREIAGADAPVAITAFNSTDKTLTAVGVAFDTATPTLCQFTTTGTLPVTSPQIAVSEWYWAVGVTADTFKIYASKADAESGDNPFSITSAGVNSNVVPWTLSTKFYLEELSFDTYVDCAYRYTGSPTSSIGSLPRFNGQDLVINGDGFGFTDTPINDTVTIEAHGQAVQVSEAQIGFPIRMEVTPLPVATPGAAGAKGSSLVDAQHVRLATMMFVDTIGGFINGTPIQLETTEQIIPGNPPEPRTGIFKQSFMNGWENFGSDTITITHDDPYQIKLIGIFYRIEG
jgi:hypothetical protein